MNLIETHIKAQLDFSFFCREVLGYRKDENYGFKDFTPIHDDLCSFLSSVGRFKMVLMPRYTFKSAVCTAGYSLWRLVKNPNLRILIYSDSATKAQGFLSDIKHQVEGKAPNSRFRELYPKWETDPHRGKWNESEIVVSSRKQALRESSVDTGGIDSSKVGKHYDLIIFDDIVSDLNVTTKQQMDKIHDCYKKSLSLLKPDGEIILVGTRWHYGDAYGRIITENKEKGTFKLFIKDAEEEIDGKLAFESIGLTREFLDQQRRDQGSYFYSCLYRNSPVDDQTALFKISDFRYYEPIPGFHEKLFVTGSIDPAGEGEDFTGITVVGMNSKKDIFVLEAVNRYLKPSQIVDEAIKMSFKWGIRKLAVETNFFKGTLEEDLRRAVQENRNNKFFTPFSVVPVKATCKATNRARILALQPYHERGQVYLPGKDFNSLSQVYSELAFQMIQYTIDGSMSPHDDLVVSFGLQTEVMSAGGEEKKPGPPDTSAANFEKQWYESTMKKMRFVPRSLRPRLQRAFS